MSNAFGNPTFAEGAPRRSREPAQPGRSPPVGRPRNMRRDARPGAGAPSGAQGEPARNDGSRTLRDRPAWAGEPPQRRSSLVPAPLVWGVIASLAVGGLAIYLRGRLPPELARTQPRAAQAPGSAAQAVASADEQTAPAPQAAPKAAAKLSMTLPAPRPPGESAPLGVTIEGSQDGGMIVVSGLAKGAALSVGTPAESGSWWLSAADLPDVAILPPPAFDGAMQVTVELRLADTAVADRKIRRFEWTNPPAAAEPVAAAPAAESPPKGVSAQEPAPVQAAATESVKPATEPAPVQAWAPPVTEPAPAKSEPPSALPAAPPPAPAAPPEIAQPNAAPSEVAPPTVAEATPAAREPLKEGEPFDDSYTGTCFAKIDGRVVVDGPCPVVWNKAPSVTLRLEGKPITLVRDNGRIWRMSWGDRTIGKVRKTESCWSGPGVKVCERDAATPAPAQKPRRAPRAH